MGEIVNFKPKQADKKTKLMITGVLVFLLITLVFVYVNRYNSVVNLLFGRVFQSGIKEQKSIALNVGETFEAAVFKDKFMIQATDGLSGYSKAGVRNFFSTYYLSQPVIKTSEKYLLAYESGGHACYLSDGVTTVRQVTTDESILCGALNQQGIFALAVNDVSSLGRVMVYDTGSNQLYDWYSGNNYIVDVALSPDGSRMAVCTMSVAAEGMSSSIIFFKLDEDKPYRTIVADDAVFTNLRFVGNRSVIAMAGAYTARYNDNGSEVWRYEYDGGTVNTFDIGSDGLMAFGVKNALSAKNSESVIFLGQNGKQGGVYESSAPAKCLSVGGDLAVLSRGREIIVINKNGNEVARTTISRDIKKVFLWGTRDIAVVTSDSVVLYRLA